MAVTEELISGIKNSEQFIQAAHSQLTIPSLVALFLSNFLILLAVGLLMVRNNPKSRGKFFSIFIITAVLSGIVLAALILLPNVVHEFLALFTP